MTITDQINSELDCAQARVLDAEVRALRLRRAAAALCPERLDDILRGLVVDHLSCVRGSWCASVRLPERGELPRIGYGASIAEAIADALHGLASVQDERAAQSMRDAEGWIRHGKVVA